MTIPANARIPHMNLKAEFASLREDILAAMERVCRNTAFILGEEVAEFEKEFAAFCEAKYCVGLNSGTSALHLALLSVGVQPGDEVITSPNTFIATAEAISYTGAKPVFVDIARATANLDTSLLERSITPRTRAIVPVHLYGRPADLEPIMEIARRHNLAVVEDACQAHGARYRGRRIGGHTSAAAFSFYPSKNLGAYGEAGALVTDDDRIAAYARAARSHGEVSRYAHEFIGYNYRMEGIQGAVLRVKLRHLEDWVTRRQQIADEYRRLLAAAPIEIPYDDPRDACAYHLFVVYVDHRDGVRTQLEAVGVETAVHYPRPLHLQQAYAALGYPRGAFRESERACERVLSLPIYPSLTDEQVASIAKRLVAIVG